MATVYLSTTGNDANTYAQAQNSSTPWATPGKVQTSAVTGDTVSMAAGTYTLATINFGTPSSKGFTWNGAAFANGLPSTILDGAGASIHWYLGAGTTHIFNKVMFQNVTHTTADSLLGLNSASGGTLTMTSCAFKSIILYGDATQMLGGVIGLDWESSNQTYTVSLTNCLFYNISRVSGTSDAAYIHARSGTWTLTITNCAFHTSLTGATLLAYFYYLYLITATVTMKNVIVRSSGGTLPFTQALDGNTNKTYAVSYCDFNGLSGTPTNTSGITSDPLFVDETNGNFNLRPTSPCIGTGTL